MREMGYPPGAGDQLGQEHQTMPQSAAAAHWERELCWVCVCVCVCVRERSSQAATSRPKDVPLLFFQRFPKGTFFFGHIHPPYSLFLYFSLPPSRSDCWSPEYICLATAASTLPSARNKCFALGVKKTEGGEGWQRAEPTVLQGGGLRALVVEWIWQTLQDDTGLDSLSLHLSTIRLRRLVCAPLSFVYLETA